VYKKILKANKIHFLLYFMYFESFSESILAEDFASMKRLPTSATSSFVTEVLPLILAVIDDGVSN